MCAGPKNPKGVYVHGGSCKYCESVNHLQKDCPQHPKIKRREWQEQQRREADAAAGPYGELDPEGFGSQPAKRNNYDSGGGYGGGRSGGSSQSNRPAPAAFDDLDDDVPF